jgi:hypothetical protein
MPIVEINFAKRSRNLYSDESIKELSISADQFLLPIARERRIVNGVGTCDGSFSLVHSFSGD